MFRSGFLLLNFLCFISQFAVIESQNATVCAPGFERVLSRSLFVCTACPKGSYGFHMTCIPCPPGYFTSTTGQGSCTPCAAGHSASSNASTSCTQCLAGTYSVGAVANCAACPAGRYSSSGASSCTGCPVGESTNGLTGQTTCYNCGNGTYAPNIGTPQCVNCTAGTFSLTKSSSCTPCSPGTYNSAPGQSTCMPCGFSLVAQSYGQKSCQSCYLGFQPVNTTAAPYCIPCAPGTQNSLASGFCVPCPIGSASPYMETINCPYCMGGQYASIQGLQTCQNCPANSYSVYASTGQTTCTNCTSSSLSAGDSYFCYIN